VLDGDYSAFAAAQAQWARAEAPCAGEGEDWGPCPSANPVYGAAPAAGGEERDGGGGGGAALPPPRVKLMPCGAGACAGGAGGAAPLARLRAWRDAWLLRLAASDWAFWELAALAPSLQVAGYAALFWRRHPVVALWAGGIGAAHLSLEAYALAAIVHGQGLPATETFSSLILRRAPGAGVHVASPRSLPRGADVLAVGTNLSVPCCGAFCSGWSASNTCTSHMPCAGSACDAGSLEVAGAAPHAAGSWAPPLPARSAGCRRAWP